MPENLQKLTPDRDLICYFQLPSAIAALSSTSSTGFTVSGSWRQQFDWAVIEWNRDNTFEHPLLRPLPDGDLSGLTLTYRETRTACIPLDSTLYPTVDWPYLRLWIDTPSGDLFRRVNLSQLAVPSVGVYGPASAIFVLTGGTTPGDLIELAWDPFSTQHYNYTVVDGDTLVSAVSALAAIINSIPDSTATAVANGAAITLTLTDPAQGTNANRVGIYGSVFGGDTEIWQPQSQEFSGGTSPTAWQITIPFASLKDADTGEVFSATAVRKMRWTYAADLQPDSFTRTEFQVTVSDWTVTGANREYSVAGPGSHRIEDDSSTLTYSGTWSPSAQNRGNFSGGSIAYTITPGASLACSYTEPATHQLFLGTRMATVGGSITLTVDSLAQSFNLELTDDELVRIPLGTFSAGTHQVSATFTGAAGSYFYFDFIEIAYPTPNLPDLPANNLLTLATDWDTYHSIALAPERTAWLIQKLGFTGRANHYQGALWFFELVRKGQIYASATVTFGGTSALSTQTTLIVDSTTMTHLHLEGDTPLTVAIAFALQINNGSTGVWADALGDILTITARAMGLEGNSIGLYVSVIQSALSAFTAQPSGPTLQGGFNGSPSGVNYQDSEASIGWRTDLTAGNAINRAARDWCTSFFTALTGYGIQATAAFSTELQFADPSAGVGIAQRYYNNSPVVVNTPAIQTNFSTVSLSFWQSAHLEMAQILVSAGQTPYLQFGEVQWWYFPDSEPSMPFYDAYTKQQFQSTYSRAISLISSNTVDPATFPQESVFLPDQIGLFTSAITAYVHSILPQTQFEVLYPPDTNDYPFTLVVNLPANYWTSASLASFKTENFTYTGDRDLDQAEQSVNLPATLNFPPSQSSHLVGISDYTTPWAKEVGLAIANGDQSVVLFALDQFCLIGYPADFYNNIQRAISMD
jgi:hypothetical protein